MLSDLNPQQKEAVTHKEGPLLVFAGAGSGKTRVITHRIAWLIDEGAVKPGSILAVTFTRKAAGEMKERVAKLLSKADRRSIRPYIGTFHSFGALMLRRDGDVLGMPPGFSIFDPDDVLHVIKQIMDDENIDRKQYNPANIRANISSAKNEMVTPDEYVQFVQGPFDEVVAQVYPEYESRLREQVAVDFDDLQILPLKMLQENKEVRDMYNRQYQYLLVDEYQDTNMVQYQLVKLLAGKEKNVCVVGDDDQGIYSWRGATIKNILSFERDFPGAAVIHLERNYRSSANILHAAQAVITNNSERALKELWTEEKGGESICLYEAKNDKDEASYVADSIQEHQLSGGSLDDVGILYRINAQSRVLEEELLRRAIPYRLVGGVRFYERQEIKDMLAYLRFFANPQDETSFLRIVNVPPRKIGKKSLEELKHYAKVLSGGVMNLGQIVLVAWGLTSERTLWENYFPGEELSEEQAKEILNKPEFAEFSDKYKHIISVFGQLYEAGKRMNVREFLDEIIERVSYENWIDDGTPQAEARKENLYELKVVADQHKSLGPRDSQLAFLEDVALVEQEREGSAGNGAGNGGNGQDGVTLMTLHAAKGLEFDVVFIAGLEEGLFPHVRSFTNPSELEEERRLCYVGITRAKKKLHLSFAENRKMYGGLADRIPSRFIAEIPDGLMEFTSWT